jgi:hypothetical protein
MRDFCIGSRNERVLDTLYKPVMVGRKGLASCSHRLRKESTCREDGGDCCGEFASVAAFTLGRMLSRTDLARLMSSNELRLIAS